MDALDDDNPAGPLNRVVVNGARDAENTRQRLYEQVLAPLVAQYYAMKLPAHSKDQGVQSPFVHKGTGRPVNLKKRDVLAVALNRGNPQNLKKLAEGYGVTVEQIDEFLALHMTEEMWAFVQAVWDRIDSLWPMMVQTERQLTGRILERVEAEAFLTPFGELRGGYYPIVYDSQQTDPKAPRAAGGVAVTQADVDSALRDVIEPLLQTSFTYERTNVTGPLSLDFNRVFMGHLRGVINRIAFGEFLQDTLRIFKDPQITRAMQEKLGVSYRRQIEPWLARMILDAAPRKEGEEWWHTLFRKARTTATIAILGFSYTTGIAQLAGAVPAMEHVGSWAFAKAAGSLARDPVALTRMVIGKSEEMARRRDEFSRETADVIAEIQGSTSRLDMAKRMAFWHIANLEFFAVALPTWLAAYDNAIRAGSGEYEAVALADKAVRMTAGTGRAKDLSAVHGSHNELIRSLTLFYHYFSILVNQQWRAVGMARRGKVAKAARIGLFWMMLEPLASAFLMYGAPDDDDEKSDLGRWGLWAAVEIGLNAFAGVPVVRDVARHFSLAADGKRQWSDMSKVASNPYTVYLSTISNNLRSAVAALDPDKEVRDLWVRDAVQMVSLMLGVPGFQIAKTSQFFSDVAAGDAEPETLADWWDGIVRGKIEEKEAA
jgi:hypothetical protein